jgi:3-hydroxyisobutyrate dehydrogenase-like beta-hydroxyacid dehydrogenase
MLSDIGPKLFYVGDGEQARIVKLAINLMIAGTTQLMAEALVIGEKHGIDRATMLEVIGGSAIGSPFVKYKTDALIADDYSSTFTVTLMAKDLSLVRAAADEVDVPVALLERLQPLIDECIASGMGDLDFTALLPRLRRAASLE